jgi:hypothetical protein
MDLLTPIFIYNGIINFIIFYLFTIHNYAPKNITAVINSKRFSFVEGGCSNSNES